MTTTAELEQELAAVISDRDILQAELARIKSLIVEDETTQEILTTRVEALGVKIGQLETRKSEIGNMTLTEYEKSLLRADCQRQIEVLTAEKQFIVTQLPQEVI